MEDQMNSEFRTALERDGARISDDFSADFGEAAAEDGGTFAVPLTHLGLIRAAGEDAASFLHNLLTNDVKKLSKDTAQFAGLCTAKGRLLANFILWRDDHGYLLAVSRDVLGSVVRKLSMYVLRSKVKVTDASAETVLIGLSGSQADEALAKANLEPPGTVMGMSSAGASCAIRVAANAFVLAIPGEQAAQLWTALRAVARAAGTSAWNRLQIRSGLPLITANTQEEFVPQMTNLELIGGISFQKGCYPGQEIVARTQYLGRLKRRMYLAHVQGGAEPREGAPLYSPDLPDQSCGTVVNVAPAPEGGHDILAVVQLSSAEAGDVHLGSKDGPKLSFRPLPYAVT